MGPRKCGSKICLGPKKLVWTFFGVFFFYFGQKIWVGKKCGSKKNWVKKNWVRKTWVGNFLGKKKFGSEMILGQKKCGSEFFLGKKNVGRIFFRFKKMWGEKKNSGKRKGRNFVLA